MKAHVTACLALTFLLAGVISFNASAREAEACEKLLDWYIASGTPKIEMTTSGRGNVRRSAARAMLNGTFAGDCRDAFIQAMLQEAIVPKPFERDTPRAAQGSRSLQRNGQRAGTSCDAILVQPR